MASLFQWFLLFLDVHDGHVVFGAFFEGCSFGDVFHTAKVGKMVKGGKDGTRSRKLWEKKYII